MAFVALPIRLMSGRGPGLLGPPTWQYPTWSTADCPCHAQSSAQVPHAQGGLLLVLSVACLTRLAVCQTALDS
jgi:hypothetical protein